MPLRMIETTDSRSFDVSTQSAGEPREFLVRRSFDQNEIFDHVAANTEEVWDGLIRTGISGKHFGGGVWMVTVQYGVPGGASATGGASGTPIGTTPLTPDAGPSGSQSLNPSDPDMKGLEVSIDFSGSTVHVTQSIQTRLSVRRTGVAGSPVDYKRAIGVMKDSVKGCDIYAGHVEMTVTQKVPSFCLDDLRRLQGVVGKTNSETWWGFAAGRCLYLGGSGVATQRGEWTLTHKIAVGEHQSDVEVCDGLTLSTVRAWDFVWFSYMPDPDADGRSIVRDAYVEQVYREHAFSDLGLGN